MFAFGVLCRTLDNLQDSITEFGGMCGATYFSYFEKEEKDEENDFE
jgi:hypothetical protein